MDRLAFALRRDGDPNQWLERLERVIRPARGFLRGCTVPACRL